MHCSRCHLDGETMETFNAEWQRGMRELVCLSYSKHIIILENYYSGPWIVLNFNLHDNFFKYELRGLFCSYYPPLYSTKTKKWTDPNSQPS